MSGGLIYAAKAPADVEDWVPDDYPPWWDFPGPPWPPGWPIVFDGLLPATATAAIDPSTGTCAVTATVQDPDGVDAADLDGYIVRVRVYDAEDNLINIKKAADAGYSSYLLFWVTNYTGPSYGFSDSITLDTTGLQGKTLAVLCDVPGVQSHNIDGDLVDLEDSEATVCPANPTVAAIAAFVCEYDDPADYSVVATVDKGATVNAVAAVAASPANGWDYGSDSTVSAFTEGVTGIYTGGRRYTNTATAAADSAQYRVRVRYRVAGQYDFYLYSDAYSLTATIDANTPTAAAQSVSMPDATEALYTDIEVMATDPSDHAAGTMVFSVVTAPTHGSAAFVGSVTRTGVGAYKKTLRYTPNASGYPDPFLGVNTMTFKVGDGNTESGAATVTVTTEYMDEHFTPLSGAGEYGSLYYIENDPTIPVAADSSSTYRRVSYWRDTGPAPDEFEAYRCYQRYNLESKFAVFNISAASLKVYGTGNWLAQTVNVYLANNDLYPLGVEDDGNLNNLVGTFTSAATVDTTITLDKSVFNSTGYLWLIHADANHVAGNAPVVSGVGALDFGFSGTTVNDLILRFTL